MIERRLGLISEGDLGCATGYGGSSSGIFMSNISEQKIPEGRVANRRAGNRRLTTAKSESPKPPRIILEQADGRAKRVHTLGDLLLRKRRRGNSCCTQYHNRCNAEGFTDWCEKIRSDDSQYCRDGRGRITRLRVISDAPLVSMGHDDMADRDAVPHKILSAV